MKKIALMIGRIAQRGGLEKSARYLAQAFAKQGAQVTLLTMGSTIELPGIEVVSLGLPSKNSLVQLLRFDHLCQKWLTAHPQDLVFGMERTRKQDFYRAGSGVHKVYLERRKTIESFWRGLSFSINPFHQTVLRFEKAAFTSPSLRLLFTNSNMVKQEILTHYDIDPKKIQVVHNGVEYEQYKAPFEETPEKRGAYQFLFVGNGYRRKGLSFLLSALSVWKEKEWELSVVGKDKEVDHWKEMALKKGILSKVHFYGLQKELTSFYQKADCLVIPSLYDPFANVTLEALAMGLFVISSSFNGGAEILSADLGVVIEDLLNIDAFLAALDKAITAPRDKEMRLARRVSIKKLDLTHQLDRMVLLSCSNHF